MSEILQVLGPMEMLIRGCCAAAPVLVVVGEGEYEARLAGYTEGGVDILLTEDIDGREVFPVGSTVDVAIWGARKVDRVVGLVVLQVGTRLITAEVASGTFVDRRAHPRVAVGAGPRFLAIGSGPRASMKVLNVSEQGLAVVWPEGGIRPGEGRELLGWLQIPSKEPLFVEARVAHVREDEPGRAVVGIRLSEPNRALQAYVESHLAGEIVAEVA